MLDAGRVDDAGERVEAVAIERRRGLVQRLVVEDLRQLALVEVAADDRHRVDRGSGRHAQVAQRRDQPAPCGVAERQVVDGRGEDVRDLLRDQLLGRRHADVDRLRERPDRRARLLAERRVRLVADHELVRVVRERADVSREPRVRLDRERVAADRLLPFGDRGRHAVAVALGLQLAVELRDEQAAVREDQHAERARRLDEAGGRDRLAGGGRVAEAVAALRARVLLRRELRLGLLVLRRPRARSSSSSSSSTSTTARRCRSRSARPAAGSRRSARSAFPRARRSGGGAAPCPTRAAAACRTGRARGRASGRSAPSTAASGRARRRPSPRSRRRARGGGRFPRRARARRPRRGGGTARPPTSRRARCVRLRQPERTVQR